MKDTKYFLAYLLPIAGCLGIYYGGYLAPGAFYVGFVALPILEFFLPASKNNHSEEEENERKENVFFDILLWLNLPLLYILVYFALYKFSMGQMNNIEALLAMLNVGVVAGTSGINVAHELGHRSNKFEQTISKLLLLPELYMHFFVEHNLGHHKNVATDADPASSRLGENIYAFWFRSVTQSWISAWHIQTDLLKKQKESFFSVKNEMLIFQIIQIGYLAAVTFFFSWKTTLFALGIALVGVLLLEAVNYIEHYGLRRKKIADGRYEAVLPKHSWNSDHELGRILLYELTRHSDHHFKSTRKYQVLRHFDESPQLPLGYPGSMWLSLVPPLWFKVMNKRLAAVNQ
jgi:alkane 1-monooxygenase